MPPAYRHILAGAGVVAARATEATLSASGRLAAPALGSPLLGPARRTAERALDDLAAIGAREEARLRRVLEQAGRELLSGPLLDQFVAALADTRVIERLVERLLDEEVAERIVVMALESPGADRIVQRVLESDLVAASTEQLLASAELQRIVEHIANSPEVRKAIAHQSMGLADVVAEEVRERSVSGDETAERLARSVLRRRPRRLGGGSG